MKDIAAVFRIPGLTRTRWILYKELTSFFGSNLAPIALGIVAFLCGLVSGLLTLTQGATYEAITSLIFHMFYIIIIAAGIFLSMSSFVNEKKQGTMELLFTLPVSDLELTLGKFLMGAVILTSLSVAMTLVYVVGIAEAPWYMALSGVIGLIFVGLYAFSVGMFTSSLTESYLASILIATAVVLTIDVGGFMSGLLPSPAKEILTHLHGLNQFTPFTRGRIPLRGTVFFLGLAGFFLFLTTRVLESRRWKG